MERNIRRNYGIDFLRVISTFMIVILHILGNGSVLNHTVSLTLSGELLWAIKILSLCAVDCYALISGYVGINKKHKYKNIISLSLQVSFYAVIITGVEVFIAFISGNPLSEDTNFPPFTIHKELLVFFSLLLPLFLNARIRPYRRCCTA